MSHLIAYFGNEPENMSCALFAARNALYSRSDAGVGGWALGFIQAGDVLLQKRPRAEATEVDLYALARDLKADAMIGRVGFGPQGTVSAENADPFRFRSWLFGSVGEIAAFESIRDKLLDAVPDFLRRNIRGTSPSEHLFHLFLAYLHDAGILELPSPNPRQVKVALDATLSFVRRLIDDAAAAGAGPAGAPAIRLALAATNGRSLVATALAHAMQFLVIDGISDCQVCRGRTNPDGVGRRISHEGLRAAIIEADVETPGRPSWRPLADGSALIIGADRIPHVVPLGAE